MADVAAASRLAQAAIAAGLTGDTSEAGSPVVEDPASLVRFTKKDLRDILSEAVIEDEIRQMMEPHWLARLEFLTWLERPAPDMRRIRGEIHKLAVRWSRDLRSQDALGAEIPIVMLESWRADITIVGDPREDTDNSEARNAVGKTGDEKKRHEDERDEEEEDNKEPETEKDGTHATKEQSVNEEGDENMLDYDNREVVEALAESVTLAARDMVEWKEAFDKEMKAEPDFRSRRAWAARVSESQRAMEMLEERVWNLDVYKSERITKPTMQAADQMLDELQKFRIGIRMDREAFWDEFDQDGAELLLGKTEIDQSVGQEIQQAVQEDKEEDIMAEKTDIQMTDVDAETEDARMTESAEFHESSTSNNGFSGVNPDQTDELSGVANNDSNPTIVQPEQPSVEETAQDAFPSVEREEPTLPPPSRTADLKSESEKTQESNPRSPVRTYAGKGVMSWISSHTVSSKREEKSGAQPAVGIQQQDQEGQAAEAGEKISNREPTPWLPDKRGSYSPTWKWLADEKENHKVTDPDTTAAVEEGDGSSHDAARDKSSELFSSRSGSAEEVGHEDEHTADQAMIASEVTGVPQEPNSIKSSIQPEGVEGVEGAKIKAEDTEDQTLTTSDVTSMPQETSSVASGSRSVSPEIIITDEVRIKSDGSSSASHISSLPEDSSSSTSGQSEAGEEIEGENTVDTASAGPNIPEDTSLSQETHSPTAAARIESTEETGGEIENTLGDTSSTSNIARLLEEVSLPQDTSSPTASERSGSVQIIACPFEEEVDQTSTASLPQDTSPTRSGVRSGSDADAGGEVTHTVDDDAATTSDAAGPPQGSSAGEDLEAPPGVSVGENPIIVPNVRYIKPQWESLFSPDEPTFSANDFSADEVDDEDEEEVELDEVEIDDLEIDEAEIEEADDRETDDVDP